MSKRIQKLKPRRQKAAHNEIFIQNKAHISRYERRIQELFEQGINQVLIHGMQASITKAIRLALNICEFYSDVTYKIRTSTQDAEQLNDGVKEEKKRSAIHIQLTKSSLI